MSFAPRSSLSRRTLLGGAFGAAAVAATAACSSSSQASSAPGTSAAPASSGPATQTLKDCLGRTVEVPTHPQRIVALQDWAEGASVLSIGAPLVGMISRDGKFMDMVAKQWDVSKVESVSGGDNWSLEKIAALEPDLILGNGDKGQPNVAGYDVSKLQAIAPTFFVEDTTTTPDEQMHTIGLLTGRMDEVEKQKKAWHERYDGLKSRLAAKTAGMSFALIGYWPPTVWVNTPLSPNPLIHAGLELGLHLPPAASKPGKERDDYLQLTAETLLQVPSDFVIWSRDAKGDPSTMPLWKQLPAVKAGQAFEENMPPVGWSYHEWNRALDILEKCIEASRSDVVKEK